MKIESITDSLFDTVKVCKRTIGKVLLGMLLDLSFVLLFAFLWGFLWSFVNDKLYVLSGELMKESSQGLQYIEKMTLSPTILEFLGLFIVCIVILVGIYAVLQGFIWRYFIGITEKKRARRGYVGGFVLLNTYFLPMAFLYVIIDVYTRFIETVNPSVSFLMMRPTIIADAIFFMIFLVLVPAYCLIQKYKPLASISQTIKMILKNPLEILIIAGIAIIGVSVFSYINNYSGIIVTFFGVIAQLGIIAFFRIFVYYWVKKTCNF